MTSVTSEQFHDRIHDNHMYGLWELASQMTPHPMPKAKAHIWKSELFNSVLHDSGEVVPIGEERRALQLFNPGLEGVGPRRTASSVRSRCCYPAKRRGLTATRRRRSASSWKATALTRQSTVKRS